MDGGGQNVYVAQVARHLARRGHRVEVLTRRDGPSLPPVVDWLDGVRVVHVPSGPPEWRRKEELLPLMGEFTDHALRRAAEVGYDLVHANFFMSALVAADRIESLQAGVQCAAESIDSGAARRALEGLTRLSQELGK